MTTDEMLRGPITRNEVHCCPACRVIACGSCVKRRGRVWHADCYVRVLESEAGELVKHNIRRAR